MVYKGIVKGNVVILDAGITLPEGIQVEIIPVPAPQPSTRAVLLEAWGSDMPDAAWEAVEKAVAAVLPALRVPRSMKQTKVALGVAIVAGEDNAPLSCGFCQAGRVRAVECDRALLLYHVKAL